MIYFLVQNHTYVNGNVHTIPIYTNTDRSVVYFCYETRAVKREDMTEYTIVDT